MWIIAGDVDHRCRGPHGFAPRRFFEPGCMGFVPASTLPRGGHCGQPVDNRAGNRESRGQGGLAALSPTRIVDRVPEESVDREIASNGPVVPSGRFRVRWIARGSPRAGRRVRDGGGRSLIVEPDVRRTPLGG
jgi:hypothetical protein